MSELDRLEQYLKRHGYLYKRTDVKQSSADRRHAELRGKEYTGYGEKHEIVVYRDVQGEREAWFNVVCNWLSWGYTEGLLELMGPLNIMRPKDKYDSVEGWLTAQDIIDRLEAL